jgi:hypothetical protein
MREVEDIAGAEIVVDKATDRTGKPINIEIAGEDFRASTSERFKRYLTHCR